MRGFTSSYAGGDLDAYARDGQLYLVRNGGPAVAAFAFPGSDESFDLREAPDGAWLLVYFDAEGALARRRGVDRGVTWN